MKSFLARLRADVSLRAAPKPNIIYILADDFGIGNLSCDGSENYKSPNIDKDKQGKLTREEHTTRQSDPEDPAKRFDKFDVNNHRIVTREKYIANGVKKSKSR